jgi:hypothetical protein
MIRDLSLAFAERITGEAKLDRYGQVQRVYQIALSREPSEEEKQLALNTLTELTAAWEQKLQGSGDDIKQNAEVKALANLCHVVMNSAEFLFID